MAILFVAAVARLIKAFALHAEGRMFDSRSRETQVVKCLGNRSVFHGSSVMTLKRMFGVTVSVAC